MTETRDFPTAVIASISTGILLCKFSDMHEAAEYLMGHPIWTHHFADKELHQKMQAAVVRQCPNMPIKLTGVNKYNFLTKLAEIEAVVGKSVTIKKGDGATAMNPLDGIPKDKLVVIV